MIPGLPREYHAASAARTLALAVRRDTTEPGKRRAPVACVFCRKAWFDFDAGIPAVTFGRAEGLLTIDCACCNSRRTVSL